MTLEPMVTEVLIIRRQALLYRFVVTNKHTSSYLWNERRLAQEQEREN
jgi:hypothetical protein